MDEQQPSILWAPWRMEYIRGEKEKGCIFCNRIPQDNDRENLIITRGTLCFVIMNRYPYNNGHLMIVPYRHVGELENLTPAEGAEMMLLLQKSVRAMHEAMHPHGFNVGMNVGKAAGAGIDDHLHFHIVPRWPADTNFMPIIAHTKVVSEALQDTWAALRKIFAGMKSD
jgi:ATP adenylyltransferase